MSVNKTALQKMLIIRKKIIKLILTLIVANHLPISKPMVKSIAVLYCAVHWITNRFIRCGQLRVFFLNKTLPFRDATTAHSEVGCQTADLLLWDMNHFAQALSRCPGSFIDQALTPLLLQHRFGNAAQLTFTSCLSVSHDSIQASWETAPPVHKHSK